MNLLADPEFVIDLVARHYGVRHEEIVGTNREHRKSFARQVVMYILQTRGGLGPVEIGKALNRDHTTVYHGVRTIAGRIRMERVERDRLNDAIADAVAPSILLAGVSEALSEARAVVRRLEGIQEQIETQTGYRVRVVA